MSNITTMDMKEVKERKKLKSISTASLDSGSAARVYKSKLFYLICIIVIVAKFYTEGWSEAEAKFGRMTFTKNIVIFNDAMYKEFSSAIFNIIVIGCSKIFPVSANFFGYSCWNKVLTRESVFGSKVRHFVISICREQLNSQHDVCIIGWCMSGVFDGNTYTGLTKIGNRDTIYPDIWSIANSHGSVANMRLPAYIDKSNKRYQECSQWKPYFFNHSKAFFFLILFISFDSMMF